MSDNDKRHNGGSKIFQYPQFQNEVAYKEFLDSNPDYSAVAAAKKPLKGALWRSEDAGVQHDVEAWFEQGHPVSIYFILHGISF